MGRLAPQLSVPSAAVCPQQKSPLHDSMGGVRSSGGFAEATCLEAEPGRGQVKITEDLVGGPHGGIVHICATDAKVCKAGWPGRRVYHFDIWRPVTIAGVGSPAQKGVKNPEVVSGPGPQPSSRKVHGASAVA